MVKQIDLCLENYDFSFCPTRPAIKMKYYN